MGAKALGSRNIIGAFYNRLEQNTGASYIEPLSALFESNQEIETYKWLGQSPQMREWIGGRQAKGFTDNGFTIRNKKFEGTMEVLVDEIRRDKTGQVMTRVNELADRASAHWATLLVPLIVNGESAVCYDGQYFFDTDHVEENSGVQSNIVVQDIVTPTNPTPGEMEAAILAAIKRMISFKDNQGEPMNEEAAEFLVMCPTAFMDKVGAALTAETIADSSANARTNILLKIGSFKVRMAATPRLDSWTTKFAVFRTDTEGKPFVRQSELDLEVSAIAEGSELEFKEDKHWYGVKAQRNVGYGYWQRACLVQFT